MSISISVALERRIAELEAENAALRAEVKRLLTPDRPSAVSGLDAKAWAEWTKYRRQLGKRPYKTHKTAEWLAQYSPEVQRKIVAQSVSKEWHGLFELHETNTARKNTQAGIAAPENYL
jgi:hypothetical protein